METSAVCSSELWGCITCHSDPVCGKIYTYLVIFSPCRSSSVRKMLVLMFVGSVQIINRLDSQSKFQIFTPFSGRHVSGAQSSKNMAAPKRCDEYLKFGKTQRPKNSGKCLFYLSPILLEFLDSIH